MKRISSNLYALELWITGFLILTPITFMVHASLYFEISKMILLLITVLSWQVANSLGNWHPSIGVNRFTPLWITGVLSFLIILIWATIEWTSSQWIYSEAIELIQSLFYFLKWSLSYCLGFADRTHDFRELVLIIGLTMLISTALYRFIHRQIRVRYLVLVGVFFIVQWNRYIESSMQYLLWFMMSLVLYIIITRHQMLGLQAFSIRANNRSNFMMGVGFVVMVVLLTQLLTQFVPIAYLNEALSDGIPEWIAVRDAYTNRSNDLYFDFTNTIYQPQGSRLGGSIELEKTLVLIVESSQPGIRLRGSVGELYTGDRWQSNSGEWQLFDPEFPSQTLVNVTVKPVNLRTSTLLTPLNTVQLAVDSGKTLINSHAVITHKRNLFGKPLESYTLKAVLDPVNDILDAQSQSRYLMLPENYSSKVRELTSTILHNAQTSRQKAEVIEAYLRKHYTYQLMVQDYGENDFVEHFLFEGREGYCTYFASAMVVMARIADIPARYVEGYILPEKRDRKGVYRVTADRAHAWPELYIEGEGWVAFEPTPTYGLEAESIRVEVSDPQEVNDPSSASEKDRENTPTLQIKSPMVNVFIWVMGALLLMFIWLGLKIKNRRNHWNGKSEKEKAMALISRSFHSLELIDDSIRQLQRPDLKLQCILHKIEWDDSDENDIINAVYETLFSNRAMTQMKYEKIERLYFKADEYLKKNVSSLHYLYNKHVR